MKLLANLILTASVIVGALAASTAYLAPLSLPDDRLVGLTLNQPAGLAATDAGAAEPLVPKGATLDAESLAALRDHTYTALGAERPVRYVTVKEFSFTRWIGKWVFLASLGGLLVGAFLVRTASKREIATAETTAEPGADASPDAALAAILDAVDSLRRELPAMPDDDARQHAILERLGAVQTRDVPVFVDARPLLVSRLGLGGYAELMDRFAAAERQINRAWSAAADDALFESLPALDAAAELLNETKAKMPRA
ncbi:MAG: hypothetical protein D6693_08920 [Planctomycetota bacterium]|nr:MAG: hypothetical protein D6693_08920 [Planctomycetota bacterium]